MVLCAICKYWQHGLCFCIKEENEAPEHHVCDVCADVSKKKDQFSVQLIIYLVVIRFVNVI